MQGAEKLPVLRGAEGLQASDAGVSVCAGIFTNARTAPIGLVPRTTMTVTPLRHEILRFLRSESAVEQSKRAATWNVHLAFTE